MVALIKPELDEEIKKINERLEILECFDQDQWATISGNIDDIRVIFTEITALKKILTEVIKVQFKTIEAIKENKSVEDSEVEELERLFTNLRI